MIPNDYVLVFSRTALIRNSSPRPDLAKLFIDYLLSDNGQKIVAETAYLGSIIQPEGVTPTGLAPKLAKAGTIQSLELSPALLVALDPARKQRFIQNWERLITDTPAPLTGR
ncbi:hypothetical protein L1889_07120 [Paenalcaligenes niemegkensis]|uniref:hypothetical protein n=1 Tax=Paenalcaligenes niemegkensis TaxID=2895469 RepID=UPI001EE7FE52|nr:hypothetical protein [Paenalcaligenes niemegkensis]MCQ9616509.1 hypothetical protein [Paenalcaligenes niemegkensis]